MTMPSVVTLSKPFVLTPLWSHCTCTAAGTTNGLGSGTAKVGAAVLVSENEKRRERDGGVVDVRVLGLTVSALPSMVASVSNSEMGGCVRSVLGLVVVVEELAMCLMTS